MKQRRSIILTILGCALLPVMHARTGVELKGDSIGAAGTAAWAFVKMPAKTLDLLTTSMRLDMIDYLKTDSIVDVENALGGFSRIVPPFNNSYMKVQITPVTTLSIKILPYKGSVIAMTVYTIGDSIQAPDSDIRFYDADMKELDRDKLIKLADIKDFFRLKGVDKKMRDEMMEDVPFPTVEYTVYPDSDELKARLTVGTFLGKEVMERITPYLHRELEYRWTGTRYRLEK